MSAIVSPADSHFPKLPLWPTIRLSYATYFQHFGDGLRIAALWLPVIATLDGIVGWLQASWMAELTANPQMQAKLAQSMPVVVLGNVAGLGLTCAAVSIAVAWHRLLLLNEAPGLSGSNIGTRSLWRYVGIGILISLIAALPVAVTLLPMWPLGLLPGVGRAPALIAVGVLAYIVGVTLVLRLCLLLPARAAGDFNLTFKEAWRRTRGNVWRIFWGILACAVPPFVLTDLAYVAVILVPLGADINPAQWAAATAIGTCCWLLAWPIWVGFLSHTYRHFLSAV
ncbi:hypothetical protein SAMN05444159_2346 [Bradyrhizobium lablabi]|uniref:Etoposide-induced protein 2.4 (EI24) n=1 Tax=Bradyrhizobium lablabi TaxID=722472 RepID=A0A1M6PHR2_9BRAD|nr:hypothetical protein [Bradyrhizobium lablabi]SHK07454.1 hypothetical protein SAMN05444159_2346 [Bradyrhizobium lablabi]